MNRYGLGGNNYSLTIQVESKKLGVENEENKSLYDSLRDNIKLVVHKFMPTLKEWSDLLIRVETEV